MILKITIGGVNHPQIVPGCLVLSVLTSYKDEDEKFVALVFYDGQAS